MTELRDGMKIIRKRFGVTQAEMAEALHITRTAYITKEKGGTEFKLSEFVQAALFFESLVKAITGENKEKHDES